MLKKKTIQDRHPNFRNKEGKLFLVRCFKCEPSRGTENWAPAVAAGYCAWCGYEDERDGIQNLV